MVTVTVAQRRALLARRHMLTVGERVGSAAAVAGRIVALHATDPATVYMSVGARSRGLDVPAIAAELYDERSVVRVIGMRRTLFVVPTSFVSVIQAGAAHEIAIRERKRVIKIVESEGIARSGAVWLESAMESVLEALAARGGEAAGAELSKDVAALRSTIAFGEGKLWAGVTAMTSRVLFQLGVEGRLVRTRPRGTWISGQYRWARAEDWIPGGIPAMEVADARTELARCYLRAFGPATVADLQWWTGWTLGETRAALGRVGGFEVELEVGEGQPVASGWALLEDLDLLGSPDRSADTDGAAALLPALDPTIMGWKERAWYLGDHKPTLFDMNGNAGPSVWCDGRIVGGWGQCQGEVIVRMFEDVGADSLALVEVEAARLSEFLAGQKVTPRFPTPQKEINAGLAQVSRWATLFIAAFWLANLGLRAATRLWPRSERLP